MSVNAIFNAMAAGAAPSDFGERPSERVPCGEPERAVPAGSHKKSAQTAVPWRLQAPLGQRAQRPVARSRRDGEGREQLPAGGEDYSQATQKLVAFLTSFEEDGLDDVDYTD